MDFAGGTSAGGGTVELRLAAAVSVELVLCITACIYRTSDKRICCKQLNGVNEPLVEFCSSTDAEEGRKSESNHRIRGITKFDSARDN